MPQTLSESGSPRTRILFVVTKSVLGGAQRYVFDLATSLPRDRFDVAVAFGGTGIPKSPPGILSDMLAGAGVRTIYLPELGRDISVIHDRAAYRALRNLFETERPDIVHLNSSKAGGLGALAARKAHVPRIIYTAHGWPFTERVSPLARAMRFALSYATVILSDLVICVSESDRRAISWTPFSAAKLRVIRNGILATERDRDLSRREAREALFPEDDAAAHADDLWLVSVAELTPNKNLMRSIEAVRMMNESKAMPHLFYCIIGDGEQREMLQAYIRKHALEGSIRLLGFVPESRRYLAAFDSLLLASIKEGFPYAILEAGSVGLAVVASATGGIPEVIAHNDTGLLIRNPQSLEDIVDELRHLRDDPERAQLGAALRERIEDGFSFEKMRSETLALYERGPAR